MSSAGRPNERADTKSSEKQRPSGDDGVVGDPDMTRVRWERTWEVAEVQQIKCEARSQRPQVRNLARNPSTPGFKLQAWSLLIQFEDRRLETRRTGRLSA